MYVDPIIRREEERRNKPRTKKQRGARGGSMRTGGIVVALSVAAAFGIFIGKQVAPEKVRYVRPIEQTMRFSVHGNDIQPVKALVNKAIARQNEMSLAEWQAHLAALDIPVVELKTAYRD